MIEVQVYGTTVENSLFGGDVKAAFDKSQGDAVMLQVTSEGKKVIKSKRARGFKLKEIARFKN